MRNHLQIRARWCLAWLVIWSREVREAEALEGEGGQVGAAAGDPGGLAARAASKEVPDEPTIPGLPGTRGPVQILTHTVERIGRDPVPVARTCLRRSKPVRRCCSRGSGSSGESETAARVGADELGHLLAVARSDHHKLVVVIFHQLDEGVDRPLAEVLSPPGRPGERVGLVEEQDPAQRPLDRLGGLDRGLAHVARHQIAPDDLDELADPQHPGRGVDAVVWRFLPLPSC